MRLRVFSDADNLADAAAEEVAAWARHDRAFLTIGLAGGTTPRLAYERLRRLRMPWDRAHAWVTDERAVPLTHPDSNSGHDPPRPVRPRARHLPSRAVDRGRRRRRRRLRGRTGALPPPGPGRDAARPGGAGRGRRRPHRLAVPRHRGARGDPPGLRGQLGAAPVGLAPHRHPAPADRRPAHRLPGVRARTRPRSWPRCSRGTPTCRPPSSAGRSRDPCGSSTAKPPPCSAGPERPGPTHPV